MTDDTALRAIWTVDEVRRLKMAASRSNLDAPITCPD